MVYGLFSWADVLVMGKECVTLVMWRIIVSEYNPPIPVHVVEMVAPPLGKFAGSFHDKRHQKPGPIVILDFSFQHTYITFVIDLDYGLLRTYATTLFQHTEGAERILFNVLRLHLVNANRRSLRLGSHVTKTRPADYLP
jgi:hypothetical protein